MESLPVINRTYSVYKAVVQLNDHLEKRWRYSLGAKLEETILDCLSQLILAKNAPKAAKPACLLKASSYQEIAMLQLRLMLELELVNTTKIFQIQSLLAEIGRMLGGWLKSLQSR